MNGMEQDGVPGEAVLTGVYRDEPIRRSPERLASCLPPQYGRMRKLALSYGIYQQAEALIFCKQGKFMEDFEDDFDYRGEFVRYFPTYQAMNDAQLRGYFSWRTRIRRGEINRTSLSFVFVYLYELLNGIGVKSPEEGFRTLKAFWLSYREIEPKIDRYVRLWLRDYVVYYNLDRSLLDELGDAEADRAVLVLLNSREHDAGEVFAALNSLSSYNLENSGFFRRHPEEVRRVVCRVFAELSAYYDRNRKNSLCRKFFGESQTGSYTMFSSAVFYDRLTRRDYVYEVNDIYKYRCRNGKWSCERFLCYKGKLQQTGLLLKTVDFLMRRKYGFNSALKVEKITRLYREIIDREIDKLREEERENARREVVIDVSRLEAIREAALETQEKLIVEEPEEAVPPPEAPPENSFGLNELECRFLRCLLNGESCGELLKSAGAMASVLVDSINEKLFDHFGDTAVAYDGETPEPLEDYVDELKGIVGK